MLSCPDTTVLLQHCSLASIGKLSLTPGRASECLTAASARVSSADDVHDEYAAGCCHPTMV